MICPKEQGYRAMARPGLVGLAMLGVGIFNFGNVVAITQLPKNISTYYRARLEHIAINLYRSLLIFLFIIEIIVTGLRGSFLRFSPIRQQSLGSPSKIIVTGGLCRKPTNAKLNG